MKYSAPLSLACWVLSLLSLFSATNSQARPQRGTSSPARQQPTVERSERPEHPSRSKPDSVSRPETGNADAKPAQRPQQHQERPSLSPSQQSNLNQLQSDLQALQAGSDVTAEQKQDLADSLMTLAEGTTQPSEVSVQALANSLSAALDDGELSPREISQLTRAIHDVLNSANIPPEEVVAVIDDNELPRRKRTGYHFASTRTLRGLMSLNNALRTLSFPNAASSGESDPAEIEAILIASNISRDEVKAIVQALEQIAAELQSNVSEAAAPTRRRLPR